MNCVRWLLRFWKRPSQRNSNVVEAGSPHILGLPDELLLEIIKHLDLHDEFLLSQTCGALRGLTERNWKPTLQRLSHAQQLDFWTGLAYVLPNHWVCGPCGKLHKIDKRDRPTTDNRSPRCQQQDGLDFDHSYHLRHTHVQLALKLTRMGSVNRRHLENIMSPFTTETPTLSSDRPRLKYCATPKVVAERFLLQVKRKFQWNDPAVVSLSDLGLRTICPHMVILPFKVPRDTKSSRAAVLGCFSNDVHLAVASLGQEVTGHCRRCPTDYTVVAQPGIVTICTWHDLGPYGSPLSKQWTIHIPSGQNRLFQRLCLHHNPGTIRDMYFKGLVDERRTEV